MGFGTLERGVRRSPSRRPTGCQKESYEAWQSQTGSPCTVHEQLHPSSQNHQSAPHLPCWHSTLHCGRGVADAGLGAAARAPVRAGIRPRRCTGSCACLSPSGKRWAVRDPLSWLRDHPKPVESRLLCGVRYSGAQASVSPAPRVSRTRPCQNVYRAEGDGICEQRCCLMPQHRPLEAKRAESRGDFDVAASPRNDRPPPTGGVRFPCCNAMRGASADACASAPSGLRARQQQPACAMNCTSGVQPEAVRTG